MAVEGGPPTVPAGAPRQPIPQPTVVMFAGEIFTARKRILIPQPFHAARKLTDPHSWKDFGPFWDREQGGVIRVYWDAKRPRGGVRTGKVFEHFVVNWNQALVQEFKVWLRLTQSQDHDMIRTDYSLIYEEDDQLLVDQGFGEVSRVPDRPGWACYTGEKTLKFASNVLNLLAPGVMAMFLDSILDRFNEMFSGKKRPAAKSH